MIDILSEVTPMNLADERKKFFSDQTYNPQFVYQRSLNSSELTGWGLPKESLFELAKFMLSNIPNQKPKIVIDSATILQRIHAFNTKHRLQNPIQVFFSADYSTRCKIVGTNLYFQLPITYSSETFEDLIRHELETHHFRLLNHKLEPWNQLVTPEFELRRTEEGIAGMHSYIFREDKRVFKSFRTYFATFLAQKKSFAEVFSELLKTGVTPQTAWLVTYRTKRGFTDTSLPGAFTKDICYLEGMIHVWNWLILGQNDPFDLYLGRISLDQISQLKMYPRPKGLYYPSFFDDLANYREKVAEIGTVNHFADVQMETI